MLHTGSKAEIRVSTTSQFPSQLSNHRQRPHRKGAIHARRRQMRSSYCDRVIIGMMPALSFPYSVLTPPSSSFSCSHQAIANIHLVSFCKLGHVFVPFGMFPLVGFDPNHQLPLFGV